MRLVAFAAALILLPAPGRAQDFSFAGDQAINMGSATLTQVMNNNVMRRPRGGSGARPAARVGTRANAGPVSLTYAPSPQVRRQVEGEIVARLQARNPEAAAALANQLRRHDVGRIYETLTRPIGLRPDDIGDVMTAYTTLGYLITNDIPDPSPTAVQGLRAQVGPRLAATPQCQAAADRARLGEEVKILFVILHSGWQSARREGNLKAYSDSIWRMFRTQSGQDLRRLAMSRDGLVER